MLLSIFFCLCDSKLYFTVQERQAKNLYIGICAGKLVSGMILSSVIYTAAKISEYDDGMVMGGAIKTENKKYRSQSNEPNPMAA